MPIWQYLLVVDRDFRTRIRPKSLFSTSTVYSIGVTVRTVASPSCRHGSLVYDDVFYPPPLRLESRKPLWRDLLSIDVTSRWREDWQSATVINSTLVVDPTIRLPDFDLHWRQWSLLNRFWTGQGHCNACHKKWGFTTTNYVIVEKSRQCHTLSIIINTSLFVIITVYLSADCDLFPTFKIAISIQH